MRSFHLIFEINTRTLAYHFYNTIFNLRQHEEIMLYDKMLEYVPEDEALVREFLQIEYDTESLNYPFTTPPFNASAALWAAKITYTACQLILFRENKEDELPQLLPAYDRVIDAGAILSADLCLRFLPQVVLQTRRIDPDDSLIGVVERHLQQWHYSSIGYSKDIVITADDEIFKNDCLQQLYADRVVAKKDADRAVQLPLQQKIRADMGMFTPVFWKTLNVSEKE